jgi:hypothetical protein
MERWSLGAAARRHIHALSLDVPALSSLERAVLTSPDVVARAAAHGVSDPAQRWLLRQPRAVRSSFVEEVVDRRHEPHVAERWMLLQPASVREAYVREVLDI